MAVVSSLVIPLVWQLLIVTENVVSMTKLNVLEELDNHYNGHRVVIRNHALDYCFDGGGDNYDDYDNNRR